MDEDIIETYHRRGDDRYIILWTPSTMNEALRTLGRWASNPDLSFTWYDAAKVSEKIRAELEPQLGRAW